VFTVAGSIFKPDGTLKVALTVALGHTPTAAAAGLVDSTEIGGNAAMPPVPRIGSFPASPHPAAKAVSSNVMNNVMNHVEHLEELLRLFI